MRRKQEVFDVVYKHLLTQKVRAINVNTECTYKNNEGLKCAAGILIHEDHYHEDIEGLNVGALEVQAALKKSKVHKNLSKFIWKLQMIHDIVEPEYWKERLEKEARKNKLKVPKL